MSILCMISYVAKESIQMLCFLMVLTAGLAVSAALACIFLVVGILGYDNHGPARVRV